MSQYHSLSLCALSLNSLTDVDARVHSLASLLTGSMFGNAVVIWQTESGGGAGLKVMKKWHNCSSEPCPWS